MPKIIFVADDDKSIRELVQEYLIQDGYEVRVFDNGKDILEACDQNLPDMIVIDIMMPEIDGLSVCKTIRGKSDIPIIIISAKDEEVDRLVGLELGSDDYLTKPFSPRELVIRAKNIFKRLDQSTKNTDSECISIGDIVIDREKRIVKRNNNSIEFTNKELMLIIELSEKKGRVFTRDQLIRRIWGYDFIGETRAIDDLVKRIRKKLKEVDSSALIETVWGYGYKIIDGER